MCLCIWLQFNWHLLLSVITVCRILGKVKQLDKADDAEIHHAVNESDQSTALYSLLASTGQAKHSDGSLDDG